MTTATVAPSKAARIAWAIIATAVAGVSIGILWWLAIPRTHSCTDIVPGAPGCDTPNRFGIATLWTAIVVAVYLGVLASLVARARVWVRLLLSGLLIGSAVWAYISTLHATPLGFGA